MMILFLLFAAMGKSMRMKNSTITINDLQTALDEAQFTVLLQPKFNLATEHVCGAEALVRWQHPTRGMLLPQVFLPLMEESGLIIKLDYFVWERVCQILHDWLVEDKMFFPISVNLSRMSLHNPQSVPFLVGLLSRYDISPSFLQLEITEDAYLENPVLVVDTVQTLHNVGFTIIMDNFGSGYSSFNTLKVIKADALKLDLRYLPIKETTENDEIMLVSLIKMANWLGMSVIAEQVETRRQRDFLEAAGCDSIQGYYFSTPVTCVDYEQNYMIQGKNFNVEADEIVPKYNMTILIIDDEALSRDLLKIIFRGLYYIHTVSSAEEGLEYLKQNSSKVKLILLDNFMPGMSGLDFLRFCKQDVKLRSIPQIMITTSDEDADQLRAFYDGAYDYITKPFTREIVLARVNHVMEISCRTSIFDIIEQKYKQQPELDAATDLLNKIAFTDLASRILLTFPEEEQVLLMIDIDDFKQVNDRYGHLTGDKVIRAIADELTKAFRKTDVVGRFGGDEFVVLMTKIQSRDVAKVKAAEIIKSVLFCCAKAFNISTSISIGLAFSERNDTLEKLISRADQALYEAKKTGKGKTITFGDIIPPVQEGDDKPMVVICSEDAQVYSTIALTYGDSAAFVHIMKKEELGQLYEKYHMRIKVICLDLQQGLKGLPGEAYAYMQQEERKKHIPILAICSEGDMLHLREAVALHIRDVILLPPQLGVIERILSRTIMEAGTRMTEDDIPNMEGEHHE